MSLWHGLPPPPKFPFWSAIIEQTHGSANVPATSEVYIDIQPPEGETWLVWIDFYLPPASAPQLVEYDQYDGTDRLPHTMEMRNIDYTRYISKLQVAKVLTNSLYASIRGENNDSVAHMFVYGYSGFKLSEPLWTPKRFNNPSIPAWKRELKTSLPSKVESLSPYSCEIYDHRLNNYVPAIILEENTPLAVDPRTNFPIERVTVITPVENLLKILEARDNPDKRPNITVETGKYKGSNLRNLSAEEYEEATGYKRYFDKWRSEGISI